MTEILQLAQLVDEHCVAQVQVWGSRIETGFDPLQAAAFELLDEFTFDEQLRRAALDHLELLFDIHVSLAFVLTGAARACGAMALE